MPRKAQGGPTPILSDAVIDEIGRLAVTTPFHDSLAALVGVHLDTFRGWLREGRRAERAIEEKGIEPTEHQERCIRVVHTLKKGRAESEVALLTLIREAANTHWQSACRLLELLKPERYGQNRHEIAQLKREIRELETKIASTVGGKG